MCVQTQAALYGATFEQSMVDEIDVSVRPFKVKTNTTTITTHSIVIATGADSVWLDVEGENDYRGGGKECICGRCVVYMCSVYIMCIHICIYTHIHICA